MKSTTWLFLLSLAYGGGGVTKHSGISDFWTDDYKVFKQIYGKTSDKDLYADSLPISYTNIEKTKRTEASEKKERFIDNDAFSDFDRDRFGERYAKIFAKQILGEDEMTTKPPKSFNFISYSDFKPISLHSDPETYNYLKHLEQYQNKELRTKSPQGVGGFKPYLKNLDDVSEEDTAYKSIQDILDAHEANKGQESDKDNERDEQIKYLTYGTNKSRKKENSRKKPGVDSIKPRCRSGRCRKRVTTSVRVRSRPYVRKIIQNRWVTG